MHEVLSIPGTSIRDVAKKFKIEESIKEKKNRLKKAKANESICKSGRK